MSDDDQSFFSDGDPDADFEFEFTEVAPKKSNRRVLFYALLGGAFLWAGLMIAMMLAVDEDTTEGEVPSSVEERWCVEHTVSKQELRDCLNDPHYRAE